MATFKELYVQAVNAPTPRQVFIKRVSEIAGVSEKTVEHWTLGTRQPSKKRKERIAIAFGSDVKALFP